MTNAKVEHPPMILTTIDDVSSTRALLADLSVRYPGLFVRPKRASKFSIIMCAAILKRIIEGGLNHWDAARASGISYAAMRNWIAWARDGQEPYKTFGQLVHVAKHRRDESRRNMTLEEAIEVIENVY